MRTRNDVYVMMDVEASGTRLGCHDLIQFGAVAAWGQNLEHYLAFPVHRPKPEAPANLVAPHFRGEPDPAALFTNVLVRPYERIKEAPRQSGLDVAEIEDCRLRPRELLSVLAERCSRETVFALHNAASDLNMMQISLWAGQVVDTAYDEDLRELAAGELESRPNVKQEHPWTDKQYSWSQYDRDATDPMKLAALVYLFTDETVQGERQPKQVAGFPRREVTKSHSSYLDAVATLGLARMALAVRGGHRGDNKAPLNELPMLWDHPAISDDGRSQSLALVRESRKPVLETDIVIARRVWAKLDRRVGEILSKKSC